MAKANTSCSIDALTPEDAAGYKAANTLGKQKAFVDTRLKQANKEHSELITQVQATHPDLINDQGEFLEDILAAEYDAAFVEAQFPLFRTDAEAEADALGKERAEKEKKLAAKPRKEKKDAVQKRSTKEVDVRKQAGAGEAVRVGDAKLRKAPAKSKTTAKTKVKDLRVGKREKNRAEAAKESKPVVKEKPEPAKREEQQPHSVKFRTAEQAWDTLKEQVDIPFIRTFAQLRSGTAASVDPEGIASAARKAWEDAFKAGKATPQVLEHIHETLGNSAEEQLAQHVADIEVAQNRRQYREAVKELLRMAFFPPAGENIPAKVRKSARELAAVDTLLWDSGTHTEDTQKAFLELVQEREKLSYTFNTKDGKQESPWAAFAMDKGLIVQVHETAQTTPTNPSKRIADATAGAVRQDDVAGEARPSNDETNTVVRKLLNAVQEGTKDEALGIFGMHKDMRDMLEAAILAAQVGGKVDMSFKLLEVPLSEWLANGVPQWEAGGLSNSRFKLVIPEGAEKSLDQLYGRASRIETPVSKPMSYGAVRMFISKTIKKFNKGTRPKIMLFKSVADMRRKRPNLHREARDSRPDKAPIPENASGYSFGNTVIIFSDNIHNRQHLAFVIGHEVIGHFGLAAVMPKAKLTKLMNDIYDTDAEIRAEADRRSDLYGMDKTEAIEEAMADLAGLVEGSTIVRVMHAIKNFLNKIGFKFEDDMARYFVHQSRRYAITGKAGMVSPDTVYDNMQELQRRYVEGRASIPLASTFMSQAAVMDGINTAEHAYERLKVAVKRAPSKEGMALNAAGVRRMVGRTLEFIQSLDNKALRSEGLQMLFNIFEKQSEHIRLLQTQYNDMTGFSNRLNFRNKVAEDPNDISETSPGPTKDERAQANKLLTFIHLFRGPKAEALIEKSASLLEYDVNGAPQLSVEGLKELQKIAHVSRNEIMSGKLSWQKRDNNGELMTDAGGKPVMETYIPDFTITDRVWEIVREQRDVVDRSATDVFLDKVRGMLNSKQQEMDNIRYNNPNLPPTTIELLSDVAKEYARVHNANAKLEGDGFTWDVKKAESFVHQVTRVMDSKFGDQKLKDWREGSDAPGDKYLAEFNADPKLQPIISRLEELNANKVGNHKAIARALADTILLESQLTNAEFYAKRTILASYVPFVRRGGLQVRVQAYDADGNAVKLDERVASMLFYGATDSHSVADELLRGLDKIFSKLGPTKMRDAEGNEVEVTLVPEKGTVVTVPPLSGSINYDELSNTLVRAGVNLSPQDREKLVKLTSAHHSTARSNLMKSGNPGWDPNIIRGVAEHIEKQSHIAGRNRYQYAVANVLADKVSAGSVWRGDKDKLARLQNEFLAAKRAGTNPALITETLQAMTAYQHIHVKSSKELTSPYIRIVHPDGTSETVNGEGLGGTYLSDGTSLVNYYNREDNISDATGEEKFGKQAGFIMSATAVLQLGLNVATSLVNMLSIATHAGLYLSTFNPSTGYGGGHGLGASYAALHKAMGNVSLFKGEFHTAANIQKLIDGGQKELDKHGLTLDEAEYLHALTEKGVLTPNLSNALIGTSRTGGHRLERAKIAEAAMFMFSRTEQYNRRVTALASYRLERDRMIESGVAKDKILNPDSKAGKELYARGIKAVNTSQGNYANFNRPAWARGNIIQYMFMYKQFLVITIQLMKNLAPKERVLFLGFLLLMSGVKGIPFADDLADIIDTLAQKFGIPWDGIEANMSQVADAIIPGASPIVMRGLFDYLFNVTASTRVGFGDLIPGTGAFKAGADFGRELKSIIGPVASSIEGVAETSALIAKYTAESIGIREDVTTLSDIGRAGFGSSGIRGMTEALVFASDGTITNKRGQIVSHDVGPWDVISRMMGFYPVEATLHNDVVRMSKGVRDHVAIMKEGYITAYRKADKEGRKEIKRAVKDWNRDTKGTPMYIRDFGNAAAKAVREAKRTTSGRFIKSAPKSVKPFAKELTEAYGLE